MPLYVDFNGIMVDVTTLPPDVRDKLAELELELSEGDITRKGYEKKKSRLLTPFFPLPSPPSEPPPPERSSHGANRIYNATRNLAPSVYSQHRKSTVHDDSDQDASHADEEDDDTSFDFAPLYNAAALASTSFPSPAVVHGTVSPTTRAKRRQIRRLRSRCHYGVTPAAALEDVPPPLPPRQISPNNIHTNVDSPPAAPTRIASAGDYNLSKSSQGASHRSRDRDLPVTPAHYNKKQSAQSNVYRQQQQQQPLNNLNSDASESSDNRRHRRSKKDSDDKLRHSVSTASPAFLPPPPPSVSHISPGSRSIQSSSDPPEGNPSSSDSPASSGSTPAPDYDEVYGQEIRALQEQLTPLTLAPHSSPAMLTSHPQSAQAQPIGQINRRRSIRCDDDQVSNVNRQSSHHSSNESSNQVNHDSSSTGSPASTHNLSSNRHHPSSHRQNSSSSSNNSNNNINSVTHNNLNDSSSQLNQSSRMSDTGDGRLNTSSQSIDSFSTSNHSNSGTGSKYKVSDKIQQLLHTLSRPKKKPLPDFYIDDETDLEIAANQLDPSSPKPEGSVMIPPVSEAISLPAGLPRSLEDALTRYGSATFKAPAVSVLDTSGKVSASFTYGKLLSRTRKIAYNLLNKVGVKESSIGILGNSSHSTESVPIKQGDRVALVFPNNDPFGFMCAFYGCLTAGVVPVPIEVPLTKRDAGSTQIGFLLGSCNVTYAITSEACFKGLPKNQQAKESHDHSSSNDRSPEFRGWPRLHWLIPEQWSSKPPKEWQPPPRISDDVPAYIEYTIDRDGAMKGVSVSRSAMISHAKLLTAASSYTEGDIMVSVLDFKREVGLWHSILASILNGMHVVFIPYALMKVNPSSWMLMITRFKATVAICKSRDLHWGLLSARDDKDVNLSSLRMLLVADGSNPWSLSSCDQFISVFNSRGFKPDALCPCAVSAEGLTVAIRRPGRTGVGATGRGVLSMSALSYGVIRVDQENSLTSLTLQDCGHILPSAMAAVVRINGPPYLCKTDEVGEICLATKAAGSCYWGLSGLTANVFRVQPINADGSLVQKDGATFVRTGLLGFMGPGSLVFICGNRDGLMQVSGRKHNTDDFIATVLAVEPMKFVYRGRIAIFSIKVLRDERICVIAEQRPECTEEESFDWMSRVLKAVDSIHQSGIYCLALVLPNQLPKTPLGGIHLAEVKRRFLEGSLHPANVLMCPHTTVTNLPKQREVQSKVGPASVMVGNIVQGNRLAVASGREVGPCTINDEMNEMSDFGRKHQYLSEILKWRAITTPDHNLFTLLNSRGTEAVTLTCASLCKRAERVACFLFDKGLLNTGDHVALIYPPGIDLIVSFYACLFLGVVPVTIRPPHPQHLQTTLPTVRMIVDVSKSVTILSTSSVIRLLKSKEAGHVINVKSWVPTIDTDDVPKKKLASIYRAPTAEMIAYLDFSVSTTGTLAGIKISHSAATALCRSIKLSCELYPSRHIALCLDPYCGLGFVLWVLNSIYSGHHSILIPPSEVEINPALWLSTVSQYKVRDTFCSYGVMELCSKGLATPAAINGLKQRGVNLACVRTCVVVAEERPRVALTTSFAKLFSSIGLSPRTVSTSFGCRVNVALCLQGASSPDPTTVYVDMRALRTDRVTLVERGSPHSLCLVESGKLLPGVKVVIANPETRGHCGDSNLGEIWVQAPFNSSGYLNVPGDDSLHNEHFNARLTTGDTSQTYARTGYLGFLRRTESVQADGELHDAVFVVGSLDETILMRGMRYHPIDIENSIMRCHKKVAECAVFTWTNLFVVVAELDGNENEALDLVPLITSRVLEEHHCLVGIVVIVDPGIIPINSRGEKQRMHLRDGFLADQLDPIYVAYNM